MFKTNSESELSEVFFVEVLKLREEWAVIGPEQPDVGDLKQLHRQPLQPQTERPPYLLIGSRWNLQVAYGNIITNKACTNDNSGLV